jgi:hypothetical protein
MERRSEFRPGAFTDADREFTYGAPEAAFLWVAAVGFHPVIYIIIAGKMKAQMILSAAQNASNSRERFRTGLILGGIVVAVIVSIFLTQNAGSESGLHLWFPQFTAKASLVANSVSNTMIDNLSSSITNLINF